VKKIIEAYDRAEAEDAAHHIANGAKRRAHGED
jgi:hypothetical protein